MEYYKNVTGTGNGGCSSQICINLKHMLLYRGTSTTSAEILYRKVVHTLGTHNDVGYQRRPTFVGKERGKESSMVVTMIINIRSFSINFS